jgi:hypothetical protein
MVAGGQPSEARRDPRCPTSLRVRLRTRLGELEASTRTVSRHGFDLRLPSAPAIGERAALSVRLPDNAIVEGHAECRSRGTRGLCGFALDLDDDNEARWAGFIEQEEATGSLWRMVGRWARGRGDEKEAVRSVLVNGALGPLFKLLPRKAGRGPDKDVALRFFMTGENGEAYRICFERHPSTRGTECDLVRELPGFFALAEQDVGRVLDQPLLLRLSESQPLVAVRVCELVRGGYAWVQGGDGMPTGLVGLATGELLLIELEGERVFPSFTDADLERVACDTFRFDMPRPVFRRTVAATADAPTIIRRAHAPDGVEAVAGAQAVTDRVQMRRYGDRSIKLYPEIWARAVDDAEHEIMGPTMRDGDNVLMLALVGHDSPRVLRLERANRVSLLGR